VIGRRNADLSVGRDSLVLHTVKTMTWTRLTTVDDWQTLAVFLLCSREWTTTSSSTSLSSTQTTSIDRNITTHISLSHLTAIHLQRWVNIPLDTLRGILDIIVSANLLTGAKHTAFSTNHLADTKHSYNQQQHKNLNNRALKLRTYAQTKPNETKAWFKSADQQADRASSTAAGPAQGFICDFPSKPGL